MRRSAARPSCWPKSWAYRGRRFLRLPRRFAQRHIAQLGHLPLASGLSGDSEWQWDEVVAPYWIEHAKFAADHGVKIAIEMHPGFVVYSPETMLKLRAIAGPAVGCNFDPSHLFWQGIDPIAAIRVLGDAIFHVHAKDTQFYPANLPLTGVLDTKPYTDERNRAWIFRTCGYGHGAEWWREFVSTLRMFGYDYVLSIEHEDSLLSRGRRPDQSRRLPE